MKPKPPAKRFLKEDEIRELFVKFDTTNSQTLDQFELKAFTQLLGIQMTMPQIMKMMSGMKLNADGAVGPDEFVRFWTVYQRQEAIAAAKKAQRRRNYKRYCVHCYYN